MQKVKYVRSCGNCGGQVTLNREDKKIPNPYHKQEGHPLEHLKELFVRGLGTWKCKNRCPDRFVNVVRLAASGKEGEKDKANRKDNLFKGMFWKDECLKTVSVRRSIAVVTKLVLAKA